jgi:hypothetical protein
MWQTTAQQTSPTILSNRNVTTHRLNRDVFLVIQNDIGQILDFRRGQFYGLDRMATEMVSLFLEGGIEAAVTSLTQAYDVTEEQLRADLTQLLRKLEEKQLIARTEISQENADRWFQNLRTKAHQGFNLVGLWILKKIITFIYPLLNWRSPRSPDQFTIELLLRLSWLSFRLLGWSRTLSLWQQWHQPVTAVATPRQQGIVETVDRAVRQAAANQLFLPMVCKERALVGYHLLRAFYGLPAILVVGIDRYPFQIHAWVEWQGLTLTDDPAHCQQFTPVVSYA